jgi:hypothetical protein
VPLFIQLVTANLPLLTASLALLGFTFGLYQFRNAQKWKRAEFAAKQLERIAADPVLVAATRVLDWRQRELPLPSALRLSKDEEHFEHKWEDLAEGVKSESDRKSFSRQMEIYRDLFDALFTYFDEVNHYVEIKLITVKQISSLKYWLEQVAHPRFGGDVNFAAFLRDYGYPGTTALMARLKVTPPQPTNASLQLPEARNAPTASTAQVPRPAAELGR